MNKSPKIIVITGAESTGKSVLTKQLAEHYHSPFYPEYARDYILGLDRKYEFGDLEIIALKQVEQYREALNSVEEFVFFDTWLIITKVWFEVAYGVCPDWIPDFISRAKIAGFILNDTDLPWEPDGVRENGGQMREVLQNLYIKNMNDFNFPCSPVGGTGADRLKNAVAAVGNFQRKNPSQENI